MPIMPLPPISQELLIKAKEAAEKSKQLAQKAANEVKTTTKQAKNVAPKTPKKTKKAPKQTSEKELIQFFNIREDVIDPKIMKTKQAQRLIEKSENYAKEIFDAWAIINRIPNYTKQFANSYIDNIKKWAEHEKASNNVIISVTNAFFKKIQDVINRFQQSDINLYNLYLVKQGQLDEVKKGRKCAEKALRILNGRNIDELSHKELKRYNKAMKYAKLHEFNSREIAGCIPEGNDKNIKAAKKLNLEKEMELIGITQDSKTLHNIYDEYAKGAKPLKKELKRFLDSINQ